MPTTPSAQTAHEITSEYPESKKRYAAESKTLSVWCDDEHQRIASRFAKNDYYCRTSSSREQREAVKQPGRSDSRHVARSVLGKNRGQAWISCSELATSSTV